jgi:hypothetical protein
MLKNFANRPYQEHKKNVKNEEKMRLKNCKKQKTEHEDIAINEEIKDVVEKCQNDDENEDGK